MRAAAIQYTAASGWRTTRGGSSEGEKKKRTFQQVCRNHTHYTTSRQRWVLCSKKKKKRSVRDTKQEVHSQPDAHPSFKALTKLLITQLAAGDTNAGRGETKKKVKWHLIDAHVVLKVECQSSLWASLSLSPVRGATRTLSKQRRNPPTLKKKKKKLATI